MKLTIEKMEKLENGSLNVEFDYDEEFLDLVKEALQKEEPTEQEINIFIFNLVEQRMKAQHNSGE